MAMAVGWGVGAGRKGRGAASGAPLGLAQGTGPAASPMAYMPKLDL